MMRLPFWKKKPELRESAFTDTLISLIQSRAAGETAKVTATGALEAACGLYARSFAACKPEGPDHLVKPLTPALLSMIARSMIRAGEIVLIIDVTANDVRLIPCAAHDVVGNHPEHTWRYRCDMQGPSKNVTRLGVAGSGVIHCRYATDPERPWYGVSPVESARIAGRLSAETSNALAQESASTLAKLLPVPGKGGDDPTLTDLKADLKKSAGEIHFVESMAGGWNAGEGSRAGRHDWAAQRLGPEPPTALVQLQQTATREILSCCGVPVALFDPSSGATGARESFRQFLHSSVQPLGRLVEEELSKKLEDDIRLDFDPLMAADVQGRARAWRSLVGPEEKMTPEIAAALAGFREMEIDR